MKNLILILIFLVLTSCKKEIKTEKNIELFPNGLKYSFQFSKAENQNGELTGFEFKIDTFEKIKDVKFYKDMEFYKLNLSFYDSIYIGKRNDTIFTFDSGLSFVEILLILNKKNKSNLGRIGDDFGVELLNSNDSIYNFKLNAHIDSNSHDVIYEAPKYPEKIIREIKTDLTGKIIKIKIKDNNIK